MGLLLLDVDQDLAGHLAVAIHRHRQVRDHTRLAVPPELDELEQLLLTAAKRQDAPPAASRNGDGYGAGMDQREWLTRTDVAQMTGVCIADRRPVAHRRTAVLESRTDPPNLAA